MLLLVVFWALGGFIAFLTGSKDIGDWIVRSSMCIGFLVGGFVYYLLTKYGYKKHLAIAQILGALFVNWHQLGKISQNNGELFERWTFVGGAFVVLADGIQKLFDGIAEE